MADLKKRVGPQFDGTTMVPDPNLEIGIDFDLWARDRAGFRSSVEMVTGGVSVHFGSFAGPEVGEQYQGALGEDRTETAYHNGMWVPSEHTGNLDIEGPVKAGEFMSKGSSYIGKPMARAPQNYRLIKK